MKRKKAKAELEREVAEALERGRRIHAEYLERMRKIYGTPLPAWVPLH